MVADIGDYYEKKIQMLQIRADRVRASRPPAGQGLNSIEYQQTFQQEDFQLSFTYYIVSHTTINTAEQSVEIQLN